MGGVGAGKPVCEVLLFSSCWGYPCFQIAAEDVSILRARAYRSLYGDAALFSSAPCYGVIKLLIKSSSKSGWCVCLVTLPLVFSGGLPPLPRYLR